MMAVGFGVEGVEKRWLWMDEVSKVEYDELLSFGVWIMGS